MQNPTSWLLFIIFGLVLFVMYIAIRRLWGSPVLVTAIGVLLSIVLMTLNGLVQGNSIFQAIFAGLLVGGLFSGGVVIMAWYFTNNQRRRNLYQPPDEEG